MIQAVENRVCEHLELIENKLSRFEERITKIENDVDVLRTVEEKLNINEDRTGNLEKELQKIIQREKECNTKDSQIKSMKKEILKESEEIHKAQKDLEELSTHLAFDRKLDKGQEIQEKVTSKIHLPDSDNSEQKGQLLEVNDETALKYTIPVSDEIEQNDQLLEVDDETSLKYTVPTSNIFETIQNVSEDGIHIKTKEKNHVLNRNPTKSNLDKKNLTIEFIMDSHGHGLVPQKIYRNKKLDVTVLPQRKKHFSGVIEHL